MDRFGSFDAAAQLAELQMLNTQLQEIDKSVFPKGHDEEVSHLENVDHLTISQVIEAHTRLEMSPRYRRIQENRSENPEVITEKINVVGFEKLTLENVKHEYKEDMTLSGFCRAETSSEQQLGNGRSAPRWISLKPFKIAKGYWDYYHDIATSSAATTTPIVLSSSWDSVKSFPDESQMTHSGSIGSSELVDSVDSLSPLDHVHYQVLTLLISYIFNLGEGNLSTGDEVDEGVAACLQKLLSLTSGVTACEEEVDHRQGFEENKLAKSNVNVDLEGLSCEEQVVAEINEYCSELMKQGKDARDDVKAAAKTILKWRARRGSIDGVELARELLVGAVS